MMKDKQHPTVVIPTVNLTNIVSKPPSSSSPPTPKTPHYEYDGCMLCVNGTPCCLQKRRATWTLKLRVALYCLSLLHPDKRYFNLKKDIYTYVDNHWDLLSINTAKSDRWRKQVQDFLSHCRHFESGWDAMGCNGHWRLIQPLIPWSFPPERDSILDDDDFGAGGGVSNNYTPEQSPRPLKSPREDPLYRNHPKSLQSPHQHQHQHQHQHHSQQQQLSQQHIQRPPRSAMLPDEELEYRKRKVADADIHTHAPGLDGDDMMALKFSPMIYAETPSPKCRTPRTNSSLNTSPSIISGSPMLSASTGAYFSLSNFSNNLSLNGNNGNNSSSSSHHPPTHHHMSPLHHWQVAGLDIDQHHQSPRSQSTSPIIPLSFSGGGPGNERLHSPSPVPSVPFNWKGTPSGHTPGKSINNHHLSTGTSPLINFNILNDTKTLPNPFSNSISGQSSPKFSTPSPNFFAHSSSAASSNHSLKVPTAELLQQHQQTSSSSSSSSATGPSSSSSSPSSMLDKPFPTSPTSSSSNAGNNDGNSGSNNNPSTNTNPNLSKLQQQNLILNCTY